MCEGGEPLLTVTLLVCAVHHRSDNRNTPRWCCSLIFRSGVPSKSIARSYGIGRRVNFITTVFSVFTVSLQSKLESHLEVALTDTSIKLLLTSHRNVTDGYQSYTSQQIGRIELDPRHIVVDHLCKRGKGGDQGQKPVVPSWHSEPGGHGVVNADAYMH